MKKAFEKYARENGLGTAEIVAEWAEIETDLQEIREGEDRTNGLGSDHWNTDGSPRCPLGHIVESENCGNCERNCPHNEISWLRVPISEWDELDGYEPLPETPDPTV